MKKSFSFVLLLSSIITTATSIYLFLNNDIIGVDLKEISIFLSCIGIILFLLSIVIFIISNKFYKGFEYGMTYFRVKNSLEKQVFNAKVFEDDDFTIPKFELYFDKDLCNGKLILRNSIILDKRLNEILLSAGLSNYVVENHYKSKREDNYIYELIDSNISFGPEYDSFEEFMEETRHNDSYSLMFDYRFNSVSVNHMLLTGITGSGKSHFLINLILQALNKEVKYDMYICDPKRSDLSVMGKKISKEKTAVDFEEILELFNSFIDRLEERKNTMENLLEKEMNKDYRNFNLEPIIFIVDEFASFMQEVEAQKKEVRDEVKKNLSKLILQGRQLGCFIWVVMQKSDSDLINTRYRENIPIKAVFGASEEQTYVTTFGRNVYVPKYNFEVGEAVLIAPYIARNPKVLFAPNLKFDILKSI